MKKSELRQLIREEVKKTLNETYKYEDTPKYFKQYEELCKTYPHFKKILEDEMGTSPRYAMNKIWDDDDRVVFYMNQSFSTSSSLWDSAKKYKILIQVPGNQDYTFLVGINKQ
jgi:hypothetical protein